MGEVIRKFSYIMLANLLVFLAIWHFFDIFLEWGSKYKIIFLILSVVSLILFSKKFFKKTLEDMEKISPINKTTNKKNKNESK